MILKKREIITNNYSNDSFLLETPVTIGRLGVLLAEEHYTIYIVDHYMGDDNDFDFKLDNGDCLTVLSVQDREEFISDCKTIIMNLEV